MSQANASQTVALHDLPIFAVFSQPKYEPEAESPVAIRPRSALASTRASMKQILVSPVKSGTTPDVYLDKSFKPLYEGEPYQDPVSLFSKKQDVLLANKRPFLPSSPAKKSSSSGDIYGTIGKYPTHSDESIQNRTYRPRSAPPGFQKHPFRPSSPAKKGGPGYYHTTILGFEYPYESEADDSTQTANRKSRSRPSSAASDRYVQTMTNKNQKPFFSRVHKQDYFDQNAPFRDVQLSPEQTRKQDMKLRTFMSSGRNPTHGFYWQQKHEGDSSMLSGHPDSSASSSSSVLTTRSTRSVNRSTSSLSANRKSSAEGYLIHPRPWSGMSHTRGSFSLYKYESEGGQDAERKRKIAERAKQPVKPFRPSGTSSYTKPSPSILNRSYHY